MFGCNFVGSESIWMKLSAAGPGRFWVWSAQKQERGKFLFFCLVNNTQLYRFLVSQISRNLHTRHGSVRQWILSEQNFENFPVRGHFFKKRKCFAKIFNDLRLQAAVTPQHYRSTKTHDQVGPLWDVHFSFLPFWFLKNTNLDLVMNYTVYCACQELSIDVLD